MKKLLLALATLALALPAVELQADDRRGYDGRRGYDRGHHVNRNWDSRSRQTVRRNDFRDTRTRVNVNVNVGNHWRPAPVYAGNRWRSAPVYHGYGVGFGTGGFGINTWSLNHGLWGPAYRQPMVIYQNSVVIAPPVTRTVVKTYSTTHTGTSILREISGRCYEREIDRYGNETRIELAPSMCNF